MLKGYIKSPATRLLLACATSACLSSSVFAADTPTIGRIVVDCDRAIAFRDGPLVKEYDLLSQNFDADKAKREEEVTRLLHARLQGVERYWDKQNEQTRRKIYANLISLALLAGSHATAKVASARPGISSQDAKALNVIADRTLAKIDTLQKVGWTAEIDVSDIAKDFTISTVVTVFAPGAALAFVAGQAAETGADTLFLAFELDNNRRLEKQSAEVLKNSIERIATKSVTGKIAEVMRLKNKIDEACDKH